MSLWPDTLTTGPIREWPGALTPNRIASPFSATLTTTLAQLDRELRELTTTRAQRESVELLVAIEPDGFRLDGRPRKGAAATHPGVILSLDSRHGHLSYPCDTFTRWEDNLRAIVLALEALRKVDRYGVTRRGEQYRGFLALEAKATETPRLHAENVIMQAASPIHSGEDLTTLVRRAKRRTHPDSGGDVARWHDVVDAELVLREAGLL